MQGMNALHSSRCWRYIALRGRQPGLTCRTKGTGTDKGLVWLCFGLLDNGSTTLPPPPVCSALHWNGWAKVLPGRALFWFTYLDRSNTLAFGAVEWSGFLSFCGRWLRDVLGISWYYVDCFSTNSVCTVVCLWYTQYSNVARIHLLSRIPKSPHSRLYSISQSLNDSFPSTLTHSLLHSIIHCMR